MKSEKEYKEELSELEFIVTRKKGTEPAFSGCYWKHFEVGVYICKCCKTTLFSSQDKFESGSGWPSYSKEISNAVIKEKIDLDHGMKRVEIMCNNCDAHLGHVFTDGPQPTGLRYCVNSVSLDFIPNIQTNESDS